MGERRPGDPEPDAGPVHVPWPARPAVGGDPARGDARPHRHQPQPRRDPPERPLGRHRLQRARPRPRTRPDAPQRRARVPRAGRAGEGDPRCDRGGAHHRADAEGDRQATGGAQRGRVLRTGLRPCAARRRLVRRGPGGAERPGSRPDRRCQPRDADARDVARAVRAGGHRVVGLRHAGPRPASRRTARDHARRDRWLLRRRRRAPCLPRRSGRHAGPRRNPRVGHRAVLRKAHDRCLRGALRARHRRGSRASRRPRTGVGRARLGDPDAGATARSGRRGATATP